MKVLKRSYKVHSGYAGGFKNPNYNQIGTGRTGHAESVEVIYNPNQVSYGTLLRVFFGSHDPTTPNRQGPDFGSQYRSIAFYTNEFERESIIDYIKTLNDGNYFSNKIITEIKPLEKFYYAEDYHQDYEKNNPDNPYVRNVSIPRLKKFQKQYPELLKEKTLKTYTLDNGNLKTYSCHMVRFFTNYELKQIWKLHKCNSRT